MGSNMSRDTDRKGHRRTGTGTQTDSVPDIRSRDHEVVVVRRIINLGTGNLDWGGNGEGLREGRSVYE